jgi:hypothetical protein
MYVAKKVKVSKLEAIIYVVTSDRSKILGRGCISNSDRALDKAIQLFGEAKMQARTTERYPVAWLQYLKMHLR